MRACKWCGKEFDPELDGEAFDIEMLPVTLSYAQFKIPLCLDCAIEAIEEGAEGVYYETCERCGKTFDLSEEKMTYASHFTWYNGTSLTDEWEEHNMILCAECAINESE